LVEPPEDMEGDVAVKELKVDGMAGEEGATVIEAPPAP